MKGLVGFQQRVLGILNKDTGGARKGKVLERGGEKAEEYKGGKYGLVEKCNC